MTLISSIARLSTFGLCFSMGLFAAATFQKPASEPAAKREFLSPRLCSPGSTKTLDEHERIERLAALEARRMQIMRWLYDHPKASKAEIERRELELDTIERLREIFSRFSKDEDVDGGTIDLLYREQCREL